MATNPAHYVHEADFEEIVGQSTTIICCGSGGVGKTTTAAVLATHAARLGRRAVVVTIDPAKRLANALGLETLGNTAHEIDPQLWDPDNERAPGGALSAMMLDAKSTFDLLVREQAASPEQAERILTNRFYRNLSGALSGTQEYMAIEKLYELHQLPDYDLVVVDTPPSRNALEFLDAPNRLTRFLQSKAFRIVTAPSLTGARLLNRATRPFLKAVSKVVGAEVIHDVVEFFAAFDGMYSGFKDRARHMQTLLTQEGSVFVIVTSPRHDAVLEAEFFAQELHNRQCNVAGVIINRLHPHFSGPVASIARARAAQLDDPEQKAPSAKKTRRTPATAKGKRQAGLLLADLWNNLASFQDIAEREEFQLSPLTDFVKPAAIARIPFLSDDVHDFATLHLLEKHLFPNG